MDARGAFLGVSEEKQGTFTKIHTIHICNFGSVLCPRSTRDGAGRRTLNRVSQSTTRKPGHLPSKCYERADGLPRFHACKAPKRGPLGESKTGANRSDGGKNFGAAPLLFKRNTKKLTLRGGYAPGSTRSRRITGRRTLNDHVNTSKCKAPARSGGRRTLAGNAVYVEGSPPSYRPR